MQRLGLLIVSMAILLSLFSFVIHGTALASPTHNSPPSAHSLLSPCPTPTGAGCALKDRTKAALVYTCHYDDATCSGKDPSYTIGPDGHLCIDDAKSWEQVKVAGGWVFEMGSANCGTNWAQIDQDYGLTNIANANITRASDGLHEDAVAYSTVVNSAMVFSPATPAQACGSVNNQPGACAPWF